jgi:hypothetical protein
MHWFCLRVLRPRAVRHRPPPDRRLPHRTLPRATALRTLPRQHQLFRLATILRAHPPIHSIRISHTPHSNNRYRCSTATNSSSSLATFAHRAHRHLKGAELIRGTKYARSSCVNEPRKPAPSPQVASAAIDSHHRRRTCSACCSARFHPIAECLRGATRPLGEGSRRAHLRALGGCGPTSSFTQQFVAPRRNVSTTHEARGSHTLRDAQRSSRCRPAPLTASSQWCRIRRIRCLASGAAAPKLDVGSRADTANGAIAAASRLSPAGISHVVTSQRSVASSPRHHFTDWKVRGRHGARDWRTGPSPIEHDAGRRSSGRAGMARATPTSAAKAKTGRELKRPKRAAPFTSETRKNRRISTSRNLGPGAAPEPHGDAACGPVHALRVLRARPSEGPTPRETGRGRELTHSLPHPGRRRASSASASSRGSARRTRKIPGSRTG